MRKLLLFAAAVFIAATLGWLPATQHDIGSLLPAQTLILTRGVTMYSLESDAGLHGEGETWAAAMEDLCATAPGEAFFGATGQIVLVGAAVDALDAVLQDDALRPAARVYAGVGTPEPAVATAFLNAHDEGVTVQELQSAELRGETLALPVLHYENGRCRLAE